MINWRELPLVRATLSLIAGIITGYATDAFPALFYGGLIISFGMIAWLSFREIAFRDRWIFGAAVTVFWGCTGFVANRQYSELRHPGHFENFIEKENIVIGRVTNAPENAALTKVFLEAEAAGTSSTDLKASTGRMLVYLRSDSLTPALQYGDVVAFRGNIKPVKPALNPQSFDYKAYLKLQNIHYQTFIAAGHWLKIDEKPRQPLVATSLPVP